MYVEEDVAVSLAVSEDCSLFYIADPEVVVAEPAAPVSTV